MARVYARRTSESDEAICSHLISTLGTREMPDTLKAIDFNEHLLPYVQDFDCGGEPWEMPLATWIMTPAIVPGGALFELNKRKGKLQVWLYANQQDDLVGYGSLGASNWEWPNKNEKRVPINVIPNVAIQKAHWGKPDNDPPKYSRQILDHLIYQARLHTDRHGLLGLFVDPRNKRAISAYKHAGFAEYFRRHMEDGIEYQSMLLKLAPSDHD